MNRQRIINAVIETIEEMREEYVPNPETRYKPGGSTGNMALNALRYKVQGNYIVIYFDTNVAPYIPYTNEPWLSDKWNGRKNPNEGWWDEFAQEFIRRFNIKIRGKIK